MTTVVQVLTNFKLISHGRVRMSLSVTPVLLFFFQEPQPYTLFWNLHRKCCVCVCADGLRVDGAQWGCWQRLACHCGRWNTKPFLETDSWKLRQSEVNWAVFCPAVYWVKSSHSASASQLHSADTHGRLSLLFITTRNGFLSDIIRDYSTKIINYSLWETAGLFPALFFTNWSWSLWFSLI